MIERHTFKELINIVARAEDYIKKLEALGITINDGPLIHNNETVIHAIAEGFQTFGAINDFQVEAVEELLYHFIYMEDCGNESEHCKSRLVVVNKGREDEHSMSCTNLDELYNVIILYIEHPECEFTFNYKHSNYLDEELKDAR